MEPVIYNEIFVIFIKLEM